MNASIYFYTIHTYTLYTLPMSLSCLHSMGTNIHKTHQKVICVLFNRLDWIFGRETSLATSWPQCIPQSTRPIPTAYPIENRQSSSPQVLRRFLGNYCTAKIIPIGTYAVSLPIRTIESHIHPYLAPLEHINVGSLN